MNRYIRYGLKGLAWLAGILVVIWIILLVYVNVNQKHLTDKISAVIHEQTRGEVTIGDLSVSLIRTFPVLSLQLSEVRLRDSLYAVHKKDLFKASDIYVSVNLFRKNLIGKIVIRKAEINILTDSTGFSNEYVLKSGKKPDEEKKEARAIPTIVLNQVLLTYINPLKNKFHQANIRNTKCSFSNTENSTEIQARLNMVVNSLGFNTDKGSYLKGKKLQGNIVLLFDKNKKDLIVKNERLTIDDHPYYFNGRFHIDKFSPDFSLTIKTTDIKYDKAVALLSDTLQSRFNSYSFTKPITISVQLVGKTLYKYVPAVRIITSIDLNSVNNFGSTVFDLVKGRADINILMNGPNGRSDTLITKMEGTVDIREAEVKYLPRQFTFTGLNTALKFINDDLVVPKFVATAGKTNLEMNGLARSFVSVLNKEPEKMELRWKISSPQIDLSDFKTFLSPASTKKAANSGSISGRVDKIFSEGDIYVLFETPSMKYKTFEAKNVNADIILKKSQLVLQRVNLKHAGGSMEISGSLQNGLQYNPVTLHTKMMNMDVSSLFRAFDNFGQDAITYSNIRGKLSADIRFQTAVTNKAKMITDASQGLIRFVLEDGELNHFAPLQEIGRKVFKKQEFDQVSFADLKNTLEIRGTTFIINEMDIRSTALNLSVEGIYDVKKGTDMSIVLPLKNLTKSQANTDLADDVKLKKGVSLRLRAKTGDDKKLKISWDPFGRAVRNKEEMKH